VTALTGFRIDCRNLTVTAGFTDILSGITMSAWPGECIGLLGPSGAGKSTLLKTLVGYLTPSRGTVQYDGQQLADVYDRIKADLGYVPQDDLVHPSLTPAAELTFAAQLRMPPATDEGTIDRRVRHVLKLMELHERADTRIRSLSGGQRKRVSMGVELLTEPPVLFLDEPTSGLDPALEEKMMHLFRTLASQGRTVLLTTHIMESLDTLDLVALLHRGRMAFFGPPAEAMTYFGVTTFTDVYKRLEGRQAGEWEAAFKGSTLYGKYVTERLTGGPSAGELWERYLGGKAKREEKREEEREEKTNEKATAEPSPSLDDEVAALRRELGK